MRVLFLSQRVPYPPDRGDKITTHHFLRHLLASGHTVRVGCLAESADEVAHARTLAKDVDAVCAPRIARSVRKVTSMRGLLTGQPLTLPFFANRELSHTLADWVRREPPELIWVYSSGMAQFALPFRQARVRLMQFAELDSDKWAQFAARARGPMRAIYAREARTLLEHEREVARAFTLSAVVSEVERALFRQRIPDVDPLVLQNGVDVEHFSIGSDSARQPHTAIFTGVMDYEPNVDGVLWFARQAWPIVRARVPDARLLIVGSRPVPQVRALHGRDGVEVTGRVPEVPPWLHRAAVAIAPLRLARGVQNKVLEAMSTGLPVVASPEAVQGLGSDGEREPGLACARDAAGLAQHVLAWFADSVAAQRCGASAAAFVRARFRWQDMFAIADGAIERALQMSKATW